MMNYKLAFVSKGAKAERTTKLWMCDAKHGARAVTVDDADKAIAALLAEGWEPFGLGVDGALWFRKTDIVQNAEPLPAGAAAV
jgi:hypothetical protein